MQIEAAKPRIDVERARQHIVEPRRAAGLGRQAAVVFADLLAPVDVLAGQIVGEEVVDNAGRVIAVFGLAITNAFLPDPRPQREYREKLQTLLKEL